ncbi:hypothetical protein [Geomesophilobacter sediminis]|uniref:Uncharacterized protein n=1 Tax=Geomesophilobacter sediminis TaxID=2798584 RepID=A0A8J7JB60_9BACT|nr:hypothetical protein [Geomesophilobacter sediminis]MBJ6724311.1 hypothetical protein [Geomesophilobacter sediminis]
MPRRSSIPVFFGLLLFFTMLEGVVFPSEPAPGRHFRYKLTSRGFAVGELKTVLAPVSYQGGRAIHFHSNLAIDADFIFFKRKGHHREEALVTSQGTVSYRKHGEENGKATSVEATLEGDTFRFRIEEGGGVRLVAVPRSRYDYTTMDCPETALQREGETREVRLLDMEHATVVTRHFRMVRSEEMDVAGRRILCKVVDFSDPNNRCRRWVTSDERGVLIVRQDGSGKGGTYSLRLVALNES